MKFAILSEPSLTTCRLSTIKATDSGPRRAAEHATHARRISLRSNPDSKLKSRGKAKHETEDEQGCRGEEDDCEEDDNDEEDIYTRYLRYVATNGYNSRRILAFITPYLHARKYAYVQRFIDSLREQPKFKGGARLPFGLYLMLLSNAP
ncbi:hypothetical protein Trydic_g20044 [Trypoxylus dichotomus]